MTCADTSVIARSPSQAGGKEGVIGRRLGTAGGKRRGGGVEVKGGGVSSA